jgi:septal ring factor EnvC (AmiA/AmiB activator)
VSVFATQHDRTVRATYVLTLILYVSITVNTAYASRQEELGNLRKRIAAMQSNMEKTRESKVEVADGLRESERAISTSNRKLAELATLQHAVDGKLSALQAQHKTLTVSIAEQQTMLGKLVYQQYREGEQEFLKLLLNNQDPNQIARDLHYFQYIARNRANWLARLRESISSLETITTSIRAQRTDLASLREQQSTQKKALKDEQLARQRLLSNISRQLHQQRHEITRLQHDESRLAKLVQKIAKMLAQPKKKSLFRNDNLPDNRFDGNPFDQLKGKLTLPVRGEITNHFGAHRPDSTVEWKGLFVKTSAGQAVKSVAAGQVVFADWLRGFGNMMIIDHGNGYMSLYGNNETLYKQVGDVVHGGDTIAAVGNSGGNEDFGLYFELRHESIPLDPIKWLATK